jgi:hypothetical protein
MARVEVRVEEIELDNDHEIPVASVRVTCRRCGHALEIYGTSEASVRRGCVMLREECPRGESNFYAPPDER